MQEGAKFGPYQLLKRIAFGGMAEIHLAKTSGIGGFEKLLALKVIHPKFSANQEFIDMLVDEAKIAVQLSHVNVAQVFDLGRIDDTYYIAMEFIDGKDLYQLLVKCSELNIRIPFDVIVFIAMEAAAGLHYAHTKSDNYGRALNLVHRDISPQNLLISYDGEVKVVDFGIAKASQRSRETESGIIKGKFFYMSPEQAWGHPLDGRTDIFSTGICLYEMITGEMLYNEEKALALLDKVRRAEIPSMRQRRVDLPPALEQIVLKALMRERNDRFQNAGELQRALSQFLYSTWPGFNRSRVKTFMEQVFGDQRFVMPLPKPEASRAAIPSGGSLMGASDFDPSDGHSVIFDLNQLSAGAGRQGQPLALKAEQMRAADDDDEDERTLAAATWEGAGSGGGGAVRPLALSLPQDDDDDETAVIDQEAIVAAQAMLAPPPMLSSAPARIVPPQTPPPVTPHPQMAPPQMPPQMAPPPVTPHPQMAPPQMPPQMAPPPQRPPQMAPPPQMPPQMTPPGSTPGLAGLPSLAPSAPQMPQGRRVVEEQHKPTLLVTQMPKRGAKLKKLITPLNVALLGLLLIGAVTALILQSRPGQELPAVQQTILEVLTEPSGAQITYDGQAQAQVSPWRLENVEIGSQHVIAVDLKGYEARSESFTVGADASGVYTRKIFLRKLPGRLELDSEPRGAEVYSDGKFLGETPLTRENLDRTQDEMDLSLRKAGFKEQREILHWGDEVQLKHMVKLVPQEAAKPEPKKPTPRKRR